jgi:hypothetical protein
MSYMFSPRLLLGFALGTSLITFAATTTRAGGPETTAPVTSAALDPALNANGWANDNVTVNLLAEDGETGSGVDHLTYFTTGAQTTASTTLDGDNASFIVSEEGTTVVHFFATDVAGNIETEQTVMVNIDKTDPVVTVEVNPKLIFPPTKQKVTVNVKGNVSDELSGIDVSSGSYQVVDEYGKADSEGEFTINENGNFAFTVDVIGSRKGRDRNGRTYSIKVTAMDEAGNSTTTTVVVRVLHDLRRPNRGGHGHGRGHG